MEEDGFKVCQFCKEKIRKEAVKCRYCGEWLEKPDAISPGLQKTAEASILTIPKPTEYLTPDKTEDETATPKQIKKRPSRKILCWISVLLLTVSFLFWIWHFVVFVASAHFSQLSPGERRYEITKLIISLIKVLIPAGVVAWLQKGKIEKLFTFSAVFAVITALAAYYFSR